MIKIEWQKFIRAYMWFGTYWTKNAARSWDQDPWHEFYKPSWRFSIHFWDHFIPMKKI